MTQEEVRAHLLQVKDIVKLTNAQVEELLTLTYTGDGSLIFDDRNPDVPDNVIDMISKVGFDVTLEYLQDRPDYDSLIFLTIQRGGQAKVQSEADKLAYKPKGTKGLGKCRKCGSDDLRFMPKQDRGGDEATSVYFQCTNCGNRWKQGG